jgi:hypothetical protein
MRWLLHSLDRTARTWWALILRDHDTEPAELSGGLLKVAIGVWLLLPMDTIGSSPTFSALSILPEWTWGMMLTALGSWHLFVLRDGDRTRRRTASTVAYYFWFSLAILFVSTNPPAIGWLAFLVAGLAQLWASVRLARTA